MIGLFVIALIGCAYVAQPVLVPVLLAWAIATIVLPIVKWLHAHGLPRVLAAILVTVLLCLLIVSLLALLSTPVAYWLGRATEIGALIKQKLQTMGQPLVLIEELQKALNAVGSGEGTLKVEAQHSHPGRHDLFHPHAGGQSIHPVPGRAGLLSHLPEPAAQHRGLFAAGSGDPPGNAANPE